MHDTAKHPPTKDRLADTGRRARTLQLALRAARAETPGWVLDDALLAALDLLAGRIALELDLAFVVEQEAA